MYDPNDTLSPNTIDTLVAIFDEPLASTSGTGGGTSTTTDLSNVMPYSLDLNLNLVPVDVPGNDSVSGNANLAATTAANTSNTGVGVPLGNTILGGFDVLDNSTTTATGGLKNVQPINSQQQPPQQPHLQDVFPREEFKFLPKIYELFDVFESKTDSRPQVHQLMEKLRHQFEHGRSILENLPGVDLVREQQDRLIHNQKEYLLKRKAQRQKYLNLPLLKNTFGPRVTHHRTSSKLIDSAIALPSNDSIMINIDSNDNTKNDNEHEQTTTVAPTFDVVDSVNIDELFTFELGNDLSIG
ncbi:6849_t:CDS:2 [Ambispora gerdemannii]|uniref:Mediator of RNA polymerase II transcription subunit 9 n=1 Tax=Ambispora gerdemannii TaxID=144530 RepID=A0A9N9FLL9_9GLOM|nr:6849_t:CDS:2 [Ambispora gerdemannii]